MVAAALPYPVIIEPGAIETLGAIARSAAPQNRVVIISDENVAKRHDYARRASKSLGDGTVIISIPPGEQLKTRNTWSELTDHLLDMGCGRDTTIVALGGGVIGDLAGFVAATYLRGVPYVQVPTTLLAMVDASIGGKTGVDTRHGKNLVGAFHRPVAVVIDPNVLRTLPEQHLRAGFAEIVKHGVIADADYFDRTASCARGLAATPDGLDALTALIRRSVEIKSAIVAQDERESGLRKVLNFGHTIGHAIEAASEFQMLHGEAVAIGLVTEARLAERLGIALEGTARNIEDVCRAAGLPTAVPSIPVDVLLEFTRSDKKSRHGKVEYALPKCVGEMAKGPQGWTFPVEDDRVREALVS